jgi:hypothetical protein
MSTELSLDQKIQEARRVVLLRQEQLHAAALTRDAGEIDQEEWDGFAARYAAATREWRVLQHIALANRPAMTETGRGETWVQS